MKGLIAALFVCIGVLAGILIHINNGTSTAKIELPAQETGLKLQVKDICEMKVLGGCVYYDTTTGVIYYKDTSVYGGGYTPVFNADGTLKNIKDYQ